MAELRHLTTKRLVLREFTKDDFQGVHAYASNPNNIRYMIWGPNSKEDTENFLKECISERDVKPRLKFDYAITLKEIKDGVEIPGKVIGGCGIYLNENRDTGMLGWTLHMDYWKQGYMVEAGEALLKYGFDELELHRIYATCNAENYGSYRVMEKLGMRREAHFVQARFGKVGSEKTWFDEYHYGILRSEWENKHEDNLHIS